MKEIFFVLVICCTICSWPGCSSRGTDNAIYFVIGKDYDQALHKDYLLLKVHKNDGIDTIRKYCSYVQWQQVKIGSIVNPDKLDR
jgi:hypothetical protein